MKYLLLIALALALLGWWRIIARKSTGRNQDTQTPGRAPQARAPQEDMVACRHCGLHLPRHEAVSGQLGLYCSQAHHSAGEGS